MAQINNTFILYRGKINAAGMLSIIVAALVFFQSCVPLPLMIGGTVAHLIIDHKAKQRRAAQEQSQTVAVADSPRQNSQPPANPKQPAERQQQTAVIASSPLKNPLLPKHKGCYREEGRTVCILE